MKNGDKKDGPWALVTGANSSIGAAFADNLAGQGYNAAVVGRRAGPNQDAGPFGKACDPAA